MIQQWGSDPVEVPADQRTSMPIGAIRELFENWRQDIKGQILGVQRYRQSHDGGTRTSPEDQGHLSESMSAFAYVGATRVR